jgi:hypothetical protein
MNFVMAADDGAETNNWLIYSPPVAASLFELGTLDLLTCVEIARIWWSR